MSRCASTPVVVGRVATQRLAALESKRSLQASGVLGRPVVTQVVALEKFYPAEGYHQNYFDRNGRQPYCQSVIRPKLTRLRKLFRDDLKPDAKN